MGCFISLYYWKTVNSELMITHLVGIGLKNRHLFKDKTFSQQINNINKMSGITSLHLQMKDVRCDKITIYLLKHVPKEL